MRLLLCFPCFFPCLAFFLYLGRLHLSFFSSSFSSTSSLGSFAVIVQVSSSFIYWPALPSLISLHWFLCSLSVVVSSTSFLALFCLSDFGMIGSMLQSFELHACPFPCCCPHCLKDTFLFPLSFVIYSLFLFFALLPGGSSFLLHLPVSSWSISLCFCI